MRDVCSVFPVLLLAIALSAGCSTERRLAKMERGVSRILHGVQNEALPDVPLGSLRLDEYAAFPSLRPGEALYVDLRRAVSLAALHSREYQTAKETLYSAALGLYVEAHAWEWNVTNSLSGLLNRDLSTPDTSISVDGNIGFSKQFFSGARLTTSLAVDTLRYLAGNHGVDITSLAGLTLTQPLLAGRGPLVARESLTQSERDLVYALRSYVRTKKSLLLTVAERYYDVLSAMDGLQIAEQNYRNLQSSRERSEAMAESGRVPVFQVDQARQKELSARSSVILREQSFQNSLDDLKRTLGLPLDVDLEADRKDLEALIQASLPVPPMTFDAACAEALANRLDYATVNDKLEDARRALLIRQDALRARLDLELSASASSPTDDHFRSIVWDKGNVSAGLDSELPFDRTNELAWYRLAMITEERRARDVEIERDRIIADLRSVWRALRSAERNYEIQKLSVLLAEKRIESTELLFQAGRVNIREVLDARDALIVARNAETLALISHRLSWLRLLYQLEQLSTEPGTLWSPALSVAAVEQARPGD